MQERIETLRAQHASLEQAIDNELHRPLPDQGTLSRLKREKLKIKDEIARLDHDEAEAGTPSQTH